MSEKREVDLGCFPYIALVVAAMGLSGIATAIESVNRTMKEQAQCQKK